MIGYRLLIIFTTMIVAIKVFRFFIGGEILIASNLGFLDLNWREISDESHREMLRLNEILKMQASGYLLIHRKCG